MASHPIYQFYAELNDYKPKIWRRFQVMNDITVARLGYIVQVLFEMKASHLMMIEMSLDENYQIHSAHNDSKNSHINPFSGENDIIMRYEVPNEDDDIYIHPSHIETHDATQTKLYNAINRSKSKLHFTYDFGDNWHVILTLEDIFEDKVLSGKELPRVLAGKGFGIVEDVGGTDGLETLASAFKKKKGEQYDEFREWLSVDDLDLTAFDIDDMNFRLKKIPRIYKQCYEDMLEPTQASIDLIERKYLKKY